MLGQQATLQIRRICVIDLDKILVLLHNITTDRGILDEIILKQDLLSNLETI
jgi:hypothetical protein